MQGRKRSYQLRQQTQVQWTGLHSNSSYRRSAVAIPGGHSSDPRALMIWSSIPRYFIPTCMGVIFFSASGLNHSCCNQSPVLFWFHWISKIVYSVPLYLIFFFLENHYMSFLPRFKARKWLFGRIILDILIFFYIINIINLLLILLFTFFNPLFCMQNVFNRHDVQFRSKQTRNCCCQ